METLALQNNLTGPAPMADLMGPAPALPVTESSQPGIFPDARDFAVDGSQFFSVQGNVHFHSPTIPTPSVAGQRPVRGRNVEDTGRSRIPVDANDLHSENEIYSAQLWGRRRGFPLYIPAPHRNLPPEYRKCGVLIGDVGMVTDEGAWDFLFNIYLPAHDPINRGNVPDGFSPLQLYKQEDVLEDDFDPGAHVSSPSVKRRSVDINLENLSSEFHFNCLGPKGALLALPHGSHRERLLNQEQMRQYAIENAASWYQYINDPRGRGRRMANGELYLITGCEKSVEGGIATFQDVDVGANFPLAFRPFADPRTGYKYRFHQGNPAITKTFSSLPHGDDGVRPRNNTLFLHGFTISLGEGVWGKLFPHVALCDIQSLQKAPGGHGSFGSMKSPSSFFSFNFSFWNSTGTGGAQYRNRNKDEITTRELSPAPKIVHPSRILNQHILRKVPNATVVITHDDDWSDILQNDGNGNDDVPSSLHLVQRVSDHFDIEEKYGAAYLVAKCKPLALSKHRGDSHQASNRTIKQFKTAAARIVDASSRKEKMLNYAIQNAESWRRCIKDEADDNPNRRLGHQIGTPQSLDVAIRVIHDYDIAQIKDEVGYDGSNVLSFTRSLNPPDVWPVMLWVTPNQLRASGLRTIDHHSRTEKILSQEQVAQQINDCLDCMDRHTQNHHLEVRLAIGKAVFTMLGYTHTTLANTLTSQLSYAPTALFNTAGKAHAPAGRGCAPNTRENLLDRLERWALDPSETEDPSSGVFWLSGAAGTGNSSVAYTLCERLRSCGRLGASFFCSRNEEQTRPRSLIIPTIVHRLVSIYNPLVNVLRDVSLPLYDPVPVDHIEKLLVEPWSTAWQPNRQVPLVVVIDALDEVEDRQGVDFVTDLIGALSRTPLRGLKFLLTSHPHPDIKNAARKFQEHFRLEEIEGSETEDAHRLLHEALPNFHPEELEALVKNSGGLFIHAATVVQYLHPPRSEFITEEADWLEQLLKTGFGQGITGNSQLVDSLDMVHWAGRSDVPRYHDELSERFASAFGRLLFWMEVMNLLGAECHREIHQAHSWALQISDGQALLEKFIHKTLIWRQLSHASLLPFLWAYYEEGSIESRLCLASPWMQHGNLARYLESSPDERNRPSLIIEIARGLEYLHGMDIIHGDLKGSKTLVTQSGRACLADFGLSLITDSGFFLSPSSVKSGGTLRWPAPELLAGSRNSFASFGAPPCYEIIIYEYPFHEATNDIAVLRSSDIKDGVWNLMRAYLGSKRRRRLAAEHLIGKSCSRDRLQDFPINALATDTTATMTDNITQLQTTTFVSVSTQTAAATTMDVQQAQDTGPFNCLGNCKSQDKRNGGNSNYQNTYATTAVQATSTPSSNYAPAYGGPSGYGSSGYGSSGYGSSGHGSSGYGSSGYDN